LAAEEELVVADEVDVLLAAAVVAAVVATVVECVGALALDVADDE
jgi:hypothetical protein